MNESTFAVGNPVQLKSGGQRMTIGEPPTEGNPRALCVWFNESRLCERFIHMGALKPAEIEPVAAVGGES